MQNAILNIALNLVLVPAFGAAGAALGTTVAYGILFIAYLLLLHLRGLNFVKQFPFIRGTLLLIVFGSFFYSLCMLWPFGPTSKVLATPPIGAGLFVLLALALKIVSIAEIRAGSRQVMHIIFKT